jgi:multidrug efflux pump subunit AcrB
MGNYQRQSWSDKTNFSILIVFTAFTLAGMFCFSFLKIRTHNPVEINEIRVSYNCYNMGPKVIEDQVTSKLEALLTSVKGISSVHSVSGAGYGVIDLYLDNRDDEHETIYDITTLIRQVYPSLPSGVSFPDIRSNTNPPDQQKQVMTYSMAGGQVAIDFINSVLKPRILAVKGVEQFNSYGDRAYIWNLRYDPALLRRYKIDLNDVSRKIGTYMSRFQIGMTKLPYNGHSASESAFLTLETARNNDIQWNKIIIGANEGRNIFLTEIFTPRLEEQGQKSFHRINGVNVVDLQVIIPEQQTIFSKTKSTINQTVAELQKIMPKGVSLKDYNKPDKEIGECLKKAVVQCICLLSCYFFAFWLIFRNLKHCFLIIFGSLASVALSFLVCSVSNISLSLYILSGLPYVVGLSIACISLSVFHLDQTPVVNRIMDLFALTSAIIGSYFVLFIFKEEQTTYFWELLLYFVIHIATTLISASLLVPALYDKLKITTISLNSSSYSMQKVRIYVSILATLRHRRKIVVLVVILLFGIPLSSLPIKVDKRNSWAKAYNSTIGTKMYRNTIKPILTKLVGGAFNRYLIRNKMQRWTNENVQENKLLVNIGMAYGTEVGRMNKLVVSIENRLKAVKGLTYYESSVFNGQSANVSIGFDDEFIKKGLQYQIKNDLIKFATFNGAADLKIFGIGQAFDNEIPPEFSNNSITVKGYNYDKMLRIGEKMVSLLKKSPRAQKVFLSAKRGNAIKRDDYGLVLNLISKDDLARQNLSVGNLGTSLSQLSLDERQTGSYVVTHEIYTPISLVSEKIALDSWELVNEPLEAGNGYTTKLKELYQINNEKSNLPIERRDQQYELVVNYDFIGSEFLSEEVKYNVMFQIWKTLPLGYLITDKNEDVEVSSRQAPSWMILFSLMFLFILSAISLNSIDLAFKIALVGLSSLIGLFYFTYLFGNSYEDGVYFAELTTLGVVQGTAVFWLRHLQRDVDSLEIEVAPVARFVYHSGKPIICFVIILFAAMLSFVFWRQNEFWYSYSVAMAGALLFSLISLLFIMPVLISKK